MKRYFLFSLFTCSLFLNCHNANRTGNSSGEDEIGITTRVVVQNLSYPWEILWGPDNMIWMTERGERSAASILQAVRSPLY